MPLIELVPPSVLPRGTKIGRPSIFSCGSEKNRQLTLRWLGSRMMPAGTWMKGLRSGGPASSRQTETDGSSVSRLAITAPAEPAPMTT